MTAAERTKALAKLREPFPPEAIGKLPKLTCKACSDARGECDKHTKARCKACGNWISPAHVDLDFVGHAALTDRLLDADPEWTWEPMATDEHGLPKLDGKGNLWIRLTVCGVTRPGVGDGPNAKEIIGDALRNAAMRFGAALDLWSKSDLPSQIEEQRTESPSKPANGQGVPQGAPAADPGRVALVKDLYAKLPEKVQAEVDEKAGGAEWWLFKNDEGLDKAAARLEEILAEIAEEAAKAEASA